MSYLSSIRMKINPWYISMHLMTSIPWFMYGLWLNCDWSQDWLLKIYLKRKTLLEVQNSSKPDIVFFGHGTEIVNQWRRPRCLYLISLLSYSVYHGFTLWLILYQDPTDFVLWLFIFIPRKICFDESVESYISQFEL